MKSLLFRNAENGLIIGTNGTEYVFMEPMQLTEWMNEHYPIASVNCLTIESIPDDKNISAIKIVRRYKNWSLVDSKNFVDRICYDKIPQRIDGLTERNIVNLKGDLDNINAKYN